MTLFGTTFDGEQIAALVSLLAVLALWGIRLRSEKGRLTAFRKWEADRKARRDAEIARENGEDAPPPAPGQKRGPWG